MLLLDIVFKISLLKMRKSYVAFLFTWFFLVFFLYTEKNRIFSTQIPFLTLSIFHLKEYNKIDNFVEKEFLLLTSY